MSSAPASMRAIALWLVPARYASSRWLSPCFVRSSLTSSPGGMMPYTVSERYELTSRYAFANLDQPHRVRGRAAALGGAPGVEDLEAVRRRLVERHVRVAEDHE